MKTLRKVFRVAYFAKDEVNGAHDVMLQKDVPYDEFHDDCDNALKEATEVLLNENITITNVEITQEAIEILITKYEYSLMRFDALHIWMEGPFLNAELGKETLNKIDQHNTNLQTEIK